MLFSSSSELSFGDGLASEISPDVDVGSHLYGLGHGDQIFPKAVFTITGTQQY